MFVVLRGKSKRLTCGSEAIRQKNICHIWGIFSKSYITGDKYDQLHY